MHDVDVQRRTRKRKRRVPAPSQEPDADSELEGPTTHRQRIDSMGPTKSAPKSRKKRAGRKQSSRSIRSLPEDRQSIVQASYLFVQKGVTLYIPWPKCSPSGDPNADDDEIEALIDDAWDDAVDSLSLNPDDIEDRTEAEGRLIRSRISQLRGAIAKEADALVPTTYGFIDIQSLTEPTPEKIAVSMEKNRQLAEDLAGSFVYQNPKDTTDIGTICRNPIFQKILNAVFFAKKGANRRAHYFTDLEMVPQETLALFMDAVVCGIDRWKTGQHTGVDFDAEVYAPVHQDSMNFLDAWLAEFKKDKHPADLAQALLREMLSNARRISDTPAEKEHTRRSMFPMDIFTK
ncbi:hypothetical protein FB451DRAFT_1257596 [Mycena latifolia]|nr:hypothetical protein FB451DRAFT_1257596 [Mycena latifolia]